MSRPSTHRALVYPVAINLTEYTGSRTDDVNALFPVIVTTSEELHEVLAALTADPCHAWGEFLDAAGPYPVLWHFNQFAGWMFYLDAPERSHLELEGF